MSLVAVRCMINTPHTGTGLPAPCFVCWSLVFRVVVLAIKGEHLQPISPVALQLSTTKTNEKAIMYLTDVGSSVGIRKYFIRSAIEQLFV